MVRPFNLRVLRHRAPALSPPSSRSSILRHTVHAYSTSFQGLINQKSAYRHHGAVERRAIESQQYGIDVTRILRVLLGPTPPWIPLRSVPAVRHQESSLSVVASARQSSR